MILKINPKDVVAIPADYNNTKGRACTYEVVAEYTEDWRKRAETEGDNGFDNDLYSSDGGEYEDDQDDYEQGYEQGQSDASNDLSEDNPYLEESAGFYGYEEGYADMTSEMEDEDEEEIYGTKPSGHKFYNKRNDKGQFA